MSEMNLLEERRAILRAISQERQTALLHDVTLPGELRRLLSDMESSEDYGRLANEQAKLYQAHGPSVIPCLLEHAYLLHRREDARDRFGTILDKLRADLQYRPELCDELAHHLNWHARSPYEVTARLVELVLEAMLDVPDRIARLIDNRRASFALRRAAAHLVLRDQRRELYPCVLQLMRELIKVKTNESFQTRLLPLTYRFAETGRAGLLLAVEAFERGDLDPHGPLILSSFRDELHHWFRESPPKPGERWIRVLAQAWSKARKALARDEMLGVLIDDWSTSPVMAKTIRRALRHEMGKNPNYLQPAGGDLQRQAESWLGTEGNEDDFAAPDVVAAANAGAKEWHAFCRNHSPRSDAHGRVAVSAFRSATPSGQARILDWMKRGHRRAFVQAVFNGLLAPDAFRGFSAATQLAVLNSPKLAEHVTSAQLERLSLKIGDPGEEVKRLVHQRLVEIRGRFGGEGSEGSGGDLE